MVRLDRHQAARDIGAGLVVGLVAIPLAIAFAIASGVSPAAGLVTVVVAGTIAALAGGSRVLVSGPAGAFVVVLFGIVQEHGAADLLVAILLAGILLVLMGWFGLGSLVKFVPYPVVTGFTAGMAVVIAVSQLHEVLGIQAVLPVETAQRLVAVARHAGATNVWALALGVGTIVVVQLLRRFAPRIPGPVVALALGTFIAWLAALPVASVADRYGALPQGLPMPGLPGLDWATVQRMMPSAVVIALLAGLESLLAAVVADGMTGQRHDSNQELVGQGLANLGSALFGGLAATGVIARTATNVQNGGRTPLAALVHVGVVVVALYLASRLVGLVPLAVLAGILLVVAWNMSERQRFVRLLRMPPTDAAVMVAVFLLTVFIGLTVAVMVGMALAMAIFMHRMAEVTQVGPFDPLSEAPATPGAVPADLPDGVVVYSIDGPFFFGAADRFQQVLDRVSGTPRVVIFRLRDVPYLDATALAALESAIEALQRRGARVLLAALRAQPLDLLERAGALRPLGDAAIHRTTADAVAHARKLLRTTS